MSATVIVAIALCCIPFIGIFIFLAINSTRRDTEAMRGFAAVLDGGVFTPGVGSRGPRATGRWNGLDVSVGFFGRLEPPVFLTTVTASRRPSPLAALLLPRTEGSIPHQEPPGDAPEWLVRLDRMYEGGCAPPEMFRLVVDEATARSLTSVEDTEIEILQDRVNIQRRENVYDAPQLIPLLDAAVQLVSRLNALHEQLVASTEVEFRRRTNEVTTFLTTIRGGDHRY